MDYKSPAPYPLVCRVVAYGQPLAEAIGGARLHHQLEPALLMAEEWRAGTVTFDFDDDVLRVRTAIRIRGRVWGLECADASLSHCPQTAALQPCPLHGASRINGILTRDAPSPLSLPDAPRSGAQDKRHKLGGIGAGGGVRALP